MDAFAASNQNMEAPPAVSLTIVIAFRGNEETLRITKTVKPYEVTQVRTNRRT
jgi:hypothetical protein